ncbi:MAG: N-(5'-phosphoribosyl)anthranilate isomerase [Gammaproteobacteria bacterium]|nr:N-(5'-phosphoribosyl)anthranilate isomerase [Gammaproteobacteria bacterium]
MGLTETAAPARVRIKICGITRPEDALAAARLGADAIGLVFFAGSPRAVSVNIAREITSVLPPFVSKVGLFVNAAPGEIKAILEDVTLDILQFHGDEDPGQCGRYSKPYIKTVRMQKTVDLNHIATRYSDAAALLLDTYVEGVRGGTGETFDWARIPADISKPVILAGGLTADNVAAAIQQVSPYAVDVSGGVESNKGIKDARKMAEFIQEVRRA